MNDQPSGFELIKAVEKALIVSDPDSMINEDEDRELMDVKNLKVLHHSVMRQKIADLKIFRGYMPVTLVIGMSEVGKSTLTSVMSANPNTTTIFDNWNECVDWIDVEQDKIDKQIVQHKETDESLAKFMQQIIVTKSEDGIDKSGKPKSSTSLSYHDTTPNRPRSPKFANLIEAASDKKFILDSILKPAVECLQSNEYKGKSYTPGEVPVVYFNESLHDAIFHHDVFFLITVEGQEAAGATHVVTLQVRRDEKDIPKSAAEFSKTETMISQMYKPSVTYGAKYVTCYPVDIMVYFSLIGSVRVTSVNSSTFNTKNVASTTQKGGLSDSVINTPNYVSNIIRKWGGRIVFEIRDDWDKADTLFGSGDMAMDITRNVNGRSIINRFRLRDGSLGKREYLAIRNLSDIIFNVVLRCVDDDLETDFELLESLVGFMDTLLLFANEQKLVIERMLLDPSVDFEPSKEDQITVKRFASALEEYIIECNARAMSAESALFSKIKKLFEI